MEIFDVFISYRRSDGEKIAQALYKYLVEKGMRVFLDREKLETGDGFPEQLREKLVMAPNYVLIATNDVFKFRNGEDWVREEIASAVEAHKKHRMDRKTITLVPENTIFPEKDELPECVQGIEKIQRVNLPIKTTENFVFSEEIEEAFLEIFRTVTKISRTNLWNAAQRWFKDNKKGTKRFANLNICETILPNVEKRTVDGEIPIFVHRGSETVQRNSQPLLDAIRESQGHLYLIGQGGIGKTTALMHVMNQEYENGTYAEGKQIPIFIELSYAPDTDGTLYRTEISSFIRRSVYRQIRTDIKVKQVEQTAVDELDEIFSIPPEVAVYPVTDIFSKQTSAPEYLLLLDGLNEVSTVRLPERNKTIFEMVSEEIQYLMEECPNVRVVLTSRFDEDGIDGPQVTRLYLDGVKDESIKQYLLSNLFSEAQIETIFQNENLLDTLRIPLFLTMYVSLSKDNDAVAQGEILRLFFSERRKNIDLYTNQNRLNAIETNVRFADVAIQAKRVTAEMYYFMLDFVLPEIALYMEQNQKFYLSIRDISRKIIEPLLSNRGDIDICGDFGKELFDQYCNVGRVDRNVASVANDMKNVMCSEDNTDYGTITRAILECCIVNLGILQENSRKYGFIHQHIRDYFTAVKNLNTIKMATYMYEEGEDELALECMNQTFYKKPVDFTIRKFMGEYLGEHKNKPFYDAEDRLCYGVPKDEGDRNQIDRVLHVYRGRMNGEGGYGLYSLLKIITEVRGCLAGCNLSELDLTKCALNATGLGKYGLSANVKGAKINPQQCLFSGHQTQIEVIAYSSDKTKFLSADRNGTVCVWDTKTGALFTMLKADSEFLRCATFVDNDEKILVAYDVGINSSFEGTHISLWDSTTGMRLHDNLLRITVNVCISSDKKQLLLYNHKDLLVMETEDLLVNHQYKVEGMIRQAVFGKADKEIVFLEINRIESGSSFVVKVFNIEKEEIIQEIEIPCNATLACDMCYVGDKVYMDLLKGFQEVFMCVDFRNNSVEKLFELPYLSAPFVNPTRQMLYIENSKLFVVWNEHEVLIYDANYKLVKNHHFKNDQFCTALLYDDMEEILIIGTRTADIYIYDTRDFHVQLENKGAMSEIVSFDYSQDGRYLAILYSRGTVRLWDVERKQFINEYSIASGRMEIVNQDEAKIQFSSSGELLLCSTKNYCKVSILRVPDFKEIYQSPHTHVYCSPNETYLALVNESEAKSILLDRNTFEVVFEKNLAVVKGFLGENRVLIECMKADEMKNLNRHAVSYAVVDVSSKTYETEIWNAEDVFSTTAICNAYFAIGDVKGLYLNSSFFDNPDSNGSICIYDSLTHELVREYEGDSGAYLRKLKFSRDGKYFVERTGYYKGGDNDAIVRCTKDFVIIYEKKHGKGVIDFFGIDTYVLETVKSHSNKDNVFIRDLSTMDSVFVDRIDSHESHYQFDTDPIQLMAIRFNTLEFALRKNSHKIGLFEGEKSEDGIQIVKREEIEDIPGVEVLGLDMRYMHETSHFTNEQKEILYSYGAIVE